MSNFTVDARRCVGLPTSNPVALLMSHTRIGKGVGGGGEGDYIAAEGALIRPGLNGNNGGVTAAVSGEIDGQRLKTMTRPDEWGPHVREWKGKQRVPVWT
jgi:hypothetical protein